MTSIAEIVQAPRFHVGDMGRQRIREARTMADFDNCARDYGLPLREVFRLHRTLFDAHYGLKNL